MNIRNMLFLAAVMGLLTACVAPHSDLKSPCAGTEGSPCGPRHPVNDWWMKAGDNS